MLQNKENVRHRIKRKWRWAGHVARMREERWAERVKWWYKWRITKEKGRNKGLGGAMT